MGHCLGLYHTFHGLCESVCAELVNGSNCSSCGNFVCDTPADPTVFNVDENTCVWDGLLHIPATSETNNNAGIAAANQIVEFFKNGDVRFQVNK